MGDEVGDAPDDAFGELPVDGDALGDADGIGDPLGVAFEGSSSPYRTSSHVSFFLSASLGVASWNERVVPFNFDVEYEPMKFWITRRCITV